MPFEIRIPYPLVEFPILTPVLFAISKIAFEVLVASVELRSILAVVPVELPKVPIITQSSVAVYVPPLVVIEPNSCVKSARLLIFVPPPTCTT